MELFPRLFPRLGKEIGTEQKMSRPSELFPRLGNECPRSGKGAIGTGHKRVCFRLSSSAAAGVVIEIAPIGAVRDMDRKEGCLDGVVGSLS